MKLKILVGTMTSTADYVAQAIQMDCADLVDEIEVVLMDGRDISVFDEDALYLICTSTYGSGDVPDNARNLYDSLDLQPKYLGHVKYGVIASRPLFERLQGGMKALFAREPDVLVPVIAECCRIKGSVVEQDERESGPRRALNFGHTLGHALEAATKYRRFRHGEAVGYGMLAAANLAVTRGARVITTARATKHEALRELGAEVAIDYRTEDFVAAVRTATSGRGADVILDIMGASYLERNIETLATGGRLVIIGLQGGRAAEINLGNLLAKRACVMATTLRVLLSGCVQTPVWPVL